MNILVGGLLGALVLMYHAYKKEDKMYLSYTHGIVVASVLYIFLFSVFGD